MKLKERAKEEWEAAKHSIPPDQITYESVYMFAYREAIKDAANAFSKWRSSIDDRADYIADLNKLTE